MNIPITEQEFIKDYFDNCRPEGTSLDSHDCWKNPHYVLNFFFSSQYDRIKKRLIEYGVTDPIMPERLQEESVDNYLKRIWKRNADAVLAAGLKIEDRSYLIGSSTINNSYVKNWLLKQEDSDDFNSGWFTRLQYHKRKFLMPVKSFDDYSKNISDIQLFRISHLPADIKFEDCVPTIGELYIAHPYRNGVYLPVSKYEHLIFRERIHELSKVMMGLGATEIRTLQNSNNKSQSTSENLSNTSASADVGRFGGNGTYSSFMKNMDENENSDSIVINFKNDPIDLPKIPDNLIWYPHDKEWQHIADSRLYGNILEYEINLSSKEINFVSEMERRNIEAQAKLFFASGNFSREISSSSFFKEESAKTTRIRIKFKSRKDY